MGVLDRTVSVLQIEITNDGKNCVLGDMLIEPYPSMRDEG